MVRQAAGFRDWRQVVLPLCVLTISGCTKPELHNFFPSGVTVERTFGQLYDDGGALKISHYIILSLTPATIFTPTAGTIEYRGSFDGLQQCLLLRPKKYFSTDNDTSRLEALPKPGALTLVLCNIDVPALRDDIATRYGEVQPDDPAAARDRFMNNEEGFRRLDVEADAADFTQSTELGAADGGKLHFAAYIEENDGATRLYVNPMPYLAGALSPPSSLDAVAPTVDEIILHTSADGTFGDAVPHTPVADDAGTLPRQTLRVAIRSTERTQSAAQIIIPYGFSYELKRVTRSGTSVVSSDLKSKGKALINLFDASQATALASSMYSTSASAVSDPTTNTFYPLLAWNGVRPPLEDDQIAYNGLSAPASWSLDLTEVIDSEPRFPAGDYEVTITALDAVNAPLPASSRTIRFALSGSDAPGSAQVTYNPTQGPIGSRVTLRALLRSDAFLAGDTSVEFNGTFDPDGEDRNGAPLPSTPSVTLTYPPAKVDVIDGANLAIRVGAVLPADAILEAPNMLYARGGLVSGTARVRTPSATPPFDETLPVSFRITENVRYGQIVDDEFQPLTDIPLVASTDAADVDATPAFNRVYVEWRIEPEPGTPPPSAIPVDVATLDNEGNSLDVRPLSLTHIGDEAGLAVYRNSGPGSRQLVFVTNAAVAGPHGTDLMAVHIVPGGVVRLNGEPPP
jgi:hypothetical protein